RPLPPSFPTRPLFRSQRQNQQQHGSHTKRRNLHLRNPPSISPLLISRREPPPCAPCRSPSRLRMPMIHPPRDEVAQHLNDLHQHHQNDDGVAHDVAAAALVAEPDGQVAQARSEERRVGKERGTRGPPDPY